jgi:hypothetical protein
MHGVQIGGQPHMQDARRVQIGGQPHMHIRGTNRRSTPHVRGAIGGRPHMHRANRRPSATLVLPLSLRMEEKKTSKHSSTPISKFRLQSKRSSGYLLVLGCVSRFARPHPAPRPCIFAEISNQSRCACRTSKTQNPNTADAQPRAQRERERAPERESPRDERERERERERVGGGGGGGGGGGAAAAGGGP